MKRWVFFHGNKKNCLDEVRKGEAGSEDIPPGFIPARTSVGRLFQGQMIK